MDKIFGAATYDPDTGCLPRTPASVHGYSVVNVYIDGKKVKIPAHRFAYERCVGPIPDGLDIDHKCRTRSCVQPSHLEPVTRAENVRRGIAARNGHGEQRSLF